MICSVISGAVGLDGVSFCGDGVGGDVKLDVICIADGVNVRQ